MHSLICCVIDKYKGYENFAHTLIDLESSGPWLKYDAAFLQYKLDAVMLSPIWLKKAKH